MKPRVGVFMPCYNMGPYLDESLESLYKQTFQDFTLIIADDASPSKETMKKLQAIDLPRCKVYFEKKNHGLIKLANKYMTKLDAEYIVLFNPDDKLHPDFLKEQVEYLDSHSDIAAVSTWVQEFGDGDRLLKYDDETSALPYMLVENNFSGAALMRKSAWLASGKHDVDPSLYPNLDYELWLSMLDHGFKLGVIKKPLFYWRIIKTSLSHSVNAERMLGFRKALLKKYLHLYQEHSAYVMNYYLELIGKFEDYYATSEEGHEWLDQQYKSLTSQNAALTSRIDESVLIPRPRTAYTKAKRRVKKTFNF